MFGSKIRSWMENHIVRPRKKGNKNKNGSSNFPVPNSTQQNVQKGSGYTIYHDSTTNTITESSTNNTNINTISSPARRREISPIQSHTTSRFGWQSPQHENIMSPKSDHLLHIPNINCVNKSQTIEISSSAALQKNSPQLNKFNEPILKNNNKIIISSSSNTKDKKHKSLPQTKMFHKKSSSPKRNETDVLHQQQQNCQRNKIKSNSIFSINQNHENSIEISKSLHSSPKKHHHQQQQQIINNDSLGYQQQQQEEFHITNELINQNDINVKNNNEFDKHNTTRSLQNHGYKIMQQNVEKMKNCSHDNNAVRYGKILTSSKRNNCSSNDQIITTTSTSTCYNLTNSMLLNYNNNNDNINANIPSQYHTNNDQQSNYNSSNNNNNNNNNNNGNHLYPATRSTNQQQNIFYHNPNLLNHHNSQLLQNNNSVQFNSVYDNQQQHQQRFNVGGGGNNTTTNVSGNIIRGGRYNGNTLIGTPQNCHSLAHVINSLSSPESAYSTGYSTDGTSPGTTYTPPEYYINIRTGTHYFPKSVNTLTIEATRQKFGLNKIEEMSPQDPLPNNHRRTESLDCSQSKITGFGIPDINFFQNKEQQQQQQESNQYYKNNNQNGLLHQINNNNNNNNNNVLHTNFKGFESPSPRQRCRIRTNPWYSTTETSSSGNTSFLAKKIEFDGSSSSSGIKSSSEAGASDKNDKNEKSSSESDTESSSTEVEAIPRTCSPGTIRRRIRRNSNDGNVAAKSIEISFKSEINISHSLHPESDEDATLNEMMGKFDESYVYEKETDILSSDSDPTDCPSDLDTGQDAGDEYDTDDLLKIDFIDTGSIQEIVDKSDGYKNTGSCSYFNYEIDRKVSKNQQRRSRKHNTEDANNCSIIENIGKRKKRLLKTRKKSCESTKNQNNASIKNGRESRSLGGTPVSLRRCNKSTNNSKTLNNSPLANRSNSMTFTEVHAIRGSFMAIAESEKAILKADLEADVKYKQLIHEAETILVSMKGCTLRDTPIASPRRICNPPTNKRVEMLRNCEADIKRELMKHQQQKLLDSVNENVIGGNNNVEGFLVNKHLEKIRYDKNSNSAPNSPKCGRMSPRKTHITNFINQIAPPEIQRRSTGTETTNTNYQINSSSKSPQLHLNDKLKVVKCSQIKHQRRFRSQSPRVPILSDSDSDTNNSKTQKLKYCKSETETYPNCHKKNNNDRKSELVSQKSKNNIRYRNNQQNDNKIIYDESDYENKNVIEDGKQPSLLSFRSIDMGNKRSHIINKYCPQSEPLKRKIYRGSSSFERLKKSLDLESEIPKQVIIENIKREQSSNTELNITTFNHQRLESQLSNDEDSVASNLSTKQQMILNTIEDLKKSLEDQSIELNGLHINPNKI